VTAHIIGGLLYDLDDQPVRTEFGRSSFDGTPHQRLVLGDSVGSDTLAISLTTTSPERIDELIEALHRIRDDKVRHQAQQIPAVA
jgi:hypothetical protein